LSHIGSESKSTLRGLGRCHFFHSWEAEGLCAALALPPPSPSNLFSFFLLNKIRSRHDWSNDPEHWSSCSKCGSIGLLGDDGEVLAWGWMLPLIKSE